MMTCMCIAASILCQSDPYPVYEWPVLWAGEVYVFHDNITGKYWNCFSGADSEHFCWEKQGERR